MRFLSGAMIAVFMLLGSSSAYAARVQNCDKVAHDVWINNGGEEWKISLEPYRYFDTNGPMLSFKLENQPAVTVRWMDDWCIWDNKLHIQQRRRYGTNGRF